MLYFPKINVDKDKLIVVAMSGGVDSSVVAALLHDQGYSIVGITLQLYDHGQALKKKGACCAGQDIYDAKTVADKLGIAHYVLNYESKFKAAVIDDFADSYIRGETPLPCVRCNQSVKFKDLLSAAKQLGASRLATGHYVRRVDGKFGVELHKGLDEHKDQSYFLFATTSEQLDYLLFPIGDLTKEQTRRLANHYGLINAQKSDSQDICFVGGGNYRDVIKQLRPRASSGGVIMHIDGFELGKHDGIINFTIGQRRKLGISYPTPLYVIKIDPVTNIVYVGPESALDSIEFIIKDVNWLDQSALNDPREVNVKIRSMKKPVLAEISMYDNDKIKVKLLSAEKAITPGQACVLYEHDRVLGGGWISNEKTI